MSENAALAVRIQEDFKKKMDEEMSAISEAFGQNIARKQEMALDRSVKYLRETYPGVFFVAYEIPLWELMSIIDKVLWRLTFGFFTSEEVRENRSDMAAAVYMGRGRVPPVWLHPNPKKLKIVELKIGLRKNATNTDGGKLCQE